jgi:hypothetical protein
MGLYRGNQRSVASRDTTNATLTAALRSVFRSKVQSDDNAKAHLKNGDFAAELAEITAARAI